MQELQACCYFTSEVSQRKQFARYDLNKILYNNETNFKFDHYVTKLKGIFNVLGKYVVPLY